MRSFRSRCRSKCRSSLGYLRETIVLHLDQRRVAQPRIPRTRRVHLCRGGLIGIGFGRVRRSTSRHGAPRAIRMPGWHDLSDRGQLLGSLDLCRKHVLLEFRHGLPPRHRDTSVPYAINEASASWIVVAPRTEPDRAGGRRARRSVEVVALEPVGQSANVVAGSEVVRPRNWPDRDPRRAGHRR
jgi:hypothetical protein